MRHNKGFIPDSILSHGGMSSFSGKSESCFNIQSGEVQEVFSVNEINESNSYRSTEYLQNVNTRSILDHVLLERNVVTPQPAALPPAPIPKRVMVQQQ
jgi:hypothetical protein